MSGKQRRLREKRKSEIRSKKLKRIRQSLHAKYGKLGNVKAGLMFTKKYQQQILAATQILMHGMALRWIHTTDARMTELTNRYNELCEREKALLEGS